MGYLILPRFSGSTWGFHTSTKRNIHSRQTFSMSTHNHILVFNACNIEQCLTHNKHESWKNRPSQIKSIHCTFLFFFSCYDFVACSKGMWPEVIELFCFLSVSVAELAWTHSKQNAETTSQSKVAKYTVCLCSCTGVLLLYFTQLKDSAQYLGDLSHKWRI